MNEETIIRTAVVTGGSRGIGRAVCVQLARQGCHVVVNYCHGAEPAEQTAALCRAEGVDAVAVQADVSTAEGCKTLFDAAVNAFGRVDVLVNNAGITRDGLLLRMSEADFDAVLNANLKGAFLCCKEAARRMVRQRHGRIINLSSVVALRGNAGQANYAASKAGLIGLNQEPGQGAGRPEHHGECRGPRPDRDRYDRRPAGGCPHRNGKGHPGRPRRPAGGRGKRGGVFCRRTKQLSHRAGALCGRRHGNVKENVFMEKRRVVVTGLGTVNPLGNTVAESWAAAKAGQCGIAPITQFDTAGFKCKLAAEVKGFDPEAIVDKKEARKMARFTLLALAAANEAIQDLSLIHI